MPAYVGAYALVDLLEYAGPVQTALRGVFGWQTARDYWFPEIRSMGAAIVVLAAALPTLVRLRKLWCSALNNCTARGWVALAGALQSLPALEKVWLNHNRGLGGEGAAALAAAVPNCPRLWFLSLDACELRHEDKARLNGSREAKWSEIHGPLS